MAGEKRWRIRVEDRDYFVEDLTLAECRQVEDATNTTWKFLDPIRSAHHMSAVLVCLYARNSTRAAAQAKVDAFTQNEALDHVELVDVLDDRPAEHHDGVPVVDPLARTGGSGTTGSS